MADSKISDLTALTGANSAAGDLFTLVDVSDTTMAASGTNKKITRDELRLAVGQPTTAVHYVFVSGSYYGPVYSGAPAGKTLGNGDVGASVIDIGATQTFDRIAVNVTTATASQTARLGIYTAGTNGLPSVLVLDAGTVACDTTGFKEATISQSLSPGRYWLVCAKQGGGGAVGFSCAYHRAAGIGATSTNIVASANGGASGSSVTGALPDPAGTYVGFNDKPVLVMLRAA
jgi:hypothetical protein